MGQTKRLLQQNQELEDIAFGILCAADVIRECDRHSGTYVESGGSGDLTEAYRVANARVTSGDIGLPGDLTRRDLTDEIKRLGEQYWPDECPGCDRD